MPKTYDAKLIIALASVGFFWGATYLGMRIGVETIPPLLVTGLRNILAGTMVLLYIVFAGKMEKMNTGRIKQNIIISLSMIVLGNGLTTFGEKYITSGLAALIGTLSPLIILILNLLLGDEKASWRTTAGIFLGLFGMYFIYQNNISDLFDPKYRLGIATVFLAIICWSSGTIYSKRSTTYPGNMLVNVCFQMLFAGVFLVGLELFMRKHIDPSSWSMRSMIAVIFLAIFGSIVGYICYMYALSKMSSTRLSVLTYINVVVALICGWLILNEEITQKIALATILIIAGVVIATAKRKDPVQVNLIPESVLK